MPLNPSLQLPEENEFIPTDFTIKERPQDVSTVKCFSLVCHALWSGIKSSWF